MPDSGYPDSGFSESGNRRRGKRRFDDDEPRLARRVQRRALPTIEQATEYLSGLPAASRWSTWDLSTAGQRGPRPHPAWLVTELGAIDTELGILKTGKEADVFLLDRAVPGTSRRCLLAAKRYRSAEHRMFHRDSGYLEGRRRSRDSRTARAMANRTAAGREMIATHWADAEFAALCQLCEAGIPVPYPVQIVGTELLLEYIGDPDGSPAPRLAETRPHGGELTDLWDQAVRALCDLAGLGVAHGDLSAYNVLVHRGRLVLIDLPQVIDVISHPRGAHYLDRDASNLAGWFRARGLGDAPGHGLPGPDDLPALLRQQAGLS